MHKHALFIFRRDLRLYDNTALNAALANAKKVSLVFIFDPKQKNHDYFSAPAFQFMAASLKELEQETQALGITINFLVGCPLDILNTLKAEFNFDALYLNQDYTPFAIKRDLSLKKWCDSRQVYYAAYHDHTLQPPNSTKKSDNTPYTVFTPFYRNAAKIKVIEPNTQSLNNISDQESIKTQPLLNIIPAILPHKNHHLALKGGRKEAFKILNNLNPHYSQKRDFPSQKSTSQLSAHHKFGTLSIRESYWALKTFYGAEHTIISELYWHDFFTSIGYFFPEVFGNSFAKKFKHLTWQNDQAKFKAWCKGHTGFPIVDAGMRELNTTGYMHNRVRMITASFLIKNLDIDWRWGERYFAQKLIDYDPAVNNGNWQWAASTGCDAQPFFRIFNPWRQQERFDKDAQYIKQWLPELQETSTKEIHTWFKSGPSLLTSYPAPIVSHKSTSEASKFKYKQAHLLAKS